MNDGVTLARPAPGTVGEGQRLDPIETGHWDALSHTRPGGQFPCSHWSVRKLSRPVTVSHRYAARPAGVSSAVDRSESEQCGQCATRPSDTVTIPTHRFHGDVDGFRVLVVGQLKV